MVEAAQQEEKQKITEPAAPQAAEEAPEFFIDLRPRVIKLPPFEEKEKINMRYPLLPPYAYAHIFWDSSKKELIYHVEEYQLNDTEKELLVLIQLGLEEMINISYVHATKSNLILKYLERNVQSILLELGAKVSKKSYQKIMYYIYRDFIGMNEIEPMLNDPYIEDIECNGVNTPIYIVHRKYQNMRTNVLFREAKELVDFVEKLAQKTGRYVSFAKPLLDGALPDGSLDYEEQTVYRKDGVAKVGKIGELVDSYYKGGESNTPVRVSGLEVPTFSPATLKTGWNKADYVYRHRNKGKMIKLTLETGRNVTLTGNHSVFVLRNSRLFSEHAFRVKEGDYAAIPLRIPENDAMKELNLPELLSKTKYSDKLVLGKIPEEIYHKKRKEIRAYLQKKYKQPIQAFSEHKRKKILPVMLHSLLTEKELRSCVIKTTSAAEIPAFLEVSRELMRLLGYYIAEGWTSSHRHTYQIQLCLGKHEKELIEDIKTCSKKCFSIEPYVEPPARNAVKVKINSFVAWITLNELIKISHGAKNKSVPEIVYNVSSELQQEFIKAWWLGDYGYTASKKLISDMLYLQLFSGKVISFSEQTKTAKINGRELRSHVFYTQRLFSKGALDSPYMIPVEAMNPLRETHHRFLQKKISRERLKKILDEERYKRFRSLEDAPEKFVKEWEKRGFLSNNKLSEKGKALLSEIALAERLISGDIGFVKVKKAELTSSSSPYVYDVSVPEHENFIGGAGGICCHNSRVNATYTSDVTTHGPTFTIRKFTKEPLTPIHLIGYKTASPEVFAYLWLAIEHKFNVMVIGETASGKTTFLNAILQFVPAEARIVSIEDTRELALAHENWIPSVSRTGFGIPNILGRQYGEVSMFDLLRETFRQNPDYVVVGEVRGKETYVLFQGMSSGHPSFSTFHAESVETLVRRLETPPISLPPSLVDSLDIVCSVMHLKEQRKNIRRLRQAEEIIRVEQELGTVKTNKVFEWNPIEDTIAYKANSYILQKINRKTGISIEKLEAEIKKRAALLAKMQEENIVTHEEVTGIVNMYYEDPEGILRQYGIK